VGPASVTLRVQQSSAVTVGGDLEGGGELVEDVGGGPSVWPLVVGDHAAGGAEAVGELLVGEATGLAGAGHLV
jgi:hypothetical protein